ncbi:sensor histidine kinase [Cellulomonas marina]|uniref:histidine kinase n=1 Tax=Cellulomonas marina TaxID=988821 RepID=A0A1I0VJW9_9CELL|nr:sensor histidine kinase [Cellulomonas marina]GIG27921.1 histidine kinase [Cellulomonas marina]SFA76622.1 HAMP domain-containing protein [Cellulomonas marina]
MTPFTLRRRVEALLLAAALVLGAAIVATVLVYVQLADRQRVVTEVYFSAVLDVDEAYLALVDDETAVRGYALTGDPDALAPYGDAPGTEGGFTAIASELARRTEVTPALRAAAADVDGAVEAWREGFAEPLVAQVDAEGLASVRPEQVDEGRTRFDEVRSEIGAFTALVREERLAAADALRGWTFAAQAISGLLLVAAAVVGVLLWTQLRRWVTGPLDALAADTRIVSAGALGHRVRSAGPGEIAALARDVEHMRQTLVEQMQAAQRSQQEVARAHALLTDQAAELQRSNRDLEQFAYVASHDLQEPLRKVASFTQLLQKRYGGELDERADQYIAFAVDGAKRMQRLITDLLEFSRVGRLGGQATDVPLAEALDEAVGDLEHRIAETGARVTHGPLPTVRGERALLVQLLLNLVGNAVKFAAPDRTPHVHVGARRVEGGWELECRDNGIGIDPEYADRVFVIFQRLHPKDVYAGTGIGLALCKKIVEHHGGQIHVEPLPPGEVGTSIRWTHPDPAPDPALEPALEPAHDLTTGPADDLAPHTAPDMATDTAPDTAPDTATDTAPDPAADPAPDPEHGPQGQDGAR